MTDDENKISEIVDKKPATHQKDISGLRDILFDTLAQLRDKENPMPIDRAKAINEVAQTLVGTAKAEIEYAKIFEGTAVSTDFMPLTELKTIPGTGVTVTRHKLR